MTKVKLKAAESSRKTVSRTTSVSVIQINLNRAGRNAVTASHVKSRKSQENGKSKAATAASINGK